jgi:hypothetical protein
MGSAFTLALAPLVLLPTGQRNIQLPLIIYISAVTCYLALYLGIVRLTCMLFLRKVLFGRLIISFALTLVMIVMSVVVTCSLSLAANDYQTLTFGWYCFPNFFWTLAELFPDRSSSWSNPEEVSAFIVLVLSSLTVAFINVLFTAKDVVLLRIETPERVKEERNKRRAKFGHEKAEVDDPDPIFG